MFCIHPEVQDDEVWFSNFTDDDTFEYWKNTSNYKYFRCGHNAYDYNGNLISGLFPVFVKSDEYFRRTGYYHECMEFCLKKSHVINMR